MFLLCCNYKSINKCIDTIKTSALVIEEVMDPDIALIAMQAYE